MAKLAIKPDATSETLLVFIQKTDTTPYTGLLFNTAGLKAYYIRPRVVATAITLVTQTVTGAYSSGGFVEIDATNAPGWYRLDVPTAVLASGVRSAGICLSGASTMFPCNIEIDLKNDGNLDSIADGPSMSLSNGPFPFLGILRKFTPAAASSTTTTLDAGAPAGVDGLYVGTTLAVFGATQGYWQERVSSAYVASTKVITHDAQSTPPTGALTAFLYMTAPASVASAIPVNVVQVNSVAVAAQNLQKAFDGTGGVTISANLSGSVGSVVGNIGGNLVGFVINPVTVGAINYVPSVNTTFIGGVAVQQSVNGFLKVDSVFIAGRYLGASGLGGQRLGEVSYP